MARAHEPGPGAEVAIRKYRRVVGGYDRRMRLGARWQRLAVERLELNPGDTVIDVACGTGLNFASIEARVGPHGSIIGIDLSPEMLAEAHARVAAQGWENVVLIPALVEEAEIEAVADAALFSFTHDVLQSPRAVANVMRQLRPGARVASVGPKFAGRWNLPVNLAVRTIARPFVTTYRGLEAPWRELERYVDRLDRRSLTLGGVYVAWGRVVAGRQDLTANG